MQGGIRRKNDLLPRYRKGAGHKKQSYLTTPMKKVIVYVMILITLWLMIQTILSEKKDVDFELDTSNSRSGVHRDNTDTLAEGGEAGNKVPKEKFNNEVAMQQEVKNLQKEYGKEPAKDPPKQAVGNDVKAMKESEPLEAVDEQAKKINDKAPFKKTDKT